MQGSSSNNDGSLTHLGEDGSARMVNVGGKADTKRVAVASGRVTMSADTLYKILAGDLKKGDVMGAARIAGIMAAKQTSTLIPLCHPLALNKVEITITPDQVNTALQVTATVETHGKTGVEMEALTAVCVACLTLYDMAKALQKEMVIGPIVLEEKTGGVSGDFKRDG
ncbi:MAG: cyclic pyranopterin monophosphate synthase MoaC [Pseudomonadota bacterium]